MSRYMTLRRQFYAACDAMVILYTQYPSITPVAEEQIEHDLIAYLDKHGYITDEVVSGDGDFVIINPEVMARLILKDVKEALKHD